MLIMSPSAATNRAQVFIDDEDRQVYLKLLAGYTEKYNLQIWAWCLMDNTCTCWSSRNPKSRWRVALG